MGFGHREGGGCALAIYWSTGKDLDTLCAVQGSESLSKLFCFVIKGSDFDNKTK